MILHHAAQVTLTDDLGGIFLMSLEREGHGRQMFALLARSPTRIIGGPISQCLSGGAWLMAYVMCVVDDWKEGGGKSTQYVVVGPSVCLSAYHYRVTIILCAANNTPCLETAS